jgi:hypothetical protein
MCSECGFSKCPSGCPNADPPRLFARCDLCNKKIYEWDEYYDIADMKICESCVYKSGTVAEMEDY